MNIFIFHRDLRIYDNKGLIALSKEEKQIYLFFILSNEQIKNNDYFSERSFQAMIYCLKNLNKKITINFIKAENEVEAIRQLISQGYKINKIYTNKDYSPYSIKRSMLMYELSVQENFIYKEFFDYLLINVYKIRKDDGNFYEVFTPFWNKIKYTYDKISSFIEDKPHNFQAMVLPNSVSIDDYTDNSFNLPLTELEVKKSILNLDENYDSVRDQLDIERNSNSKISTAIKFGVISIRQVHNWAIQKFNKFDNAFTRQLIWREFYYQITYNAQMNKRWIFGQNWNQKMNKLQWNNNKSFLDSWKNGKTGVDIIDAGMNELNNFGTMHNRIRLVCASYLVKNLLIDWREGEKYFATKLIDYDPIINQCSWQWVAGTGFDAQPFIRIFNPYLQEKKFDQNRTYINKYLKNQDIKQEIIDYKESVKIARLKYGNIK